MGQLMCQRLLKELASNEESWRGRESGFCHASHKCDRQHVAHGRLGRGWIFIAGDVECRVYFFSTGCTEPAVRMPGDGRKLK
jgi:hypothetical protein